MATPIDLEVITCEFRWNDAPEGETLTADFALLKTQEEADRLNTGLFENSEPAWVNFDERIFHYVELYRGETLDTLSNEFTVLQTIGEN